MSAKIKDLKKDYKYAMANIITNRYGLESTFLHVNNPYGLGLEDMENELIANDEEQDEKQFADDDVSEYDETGMGADMPSDGYLDMDDPAGMGSDIPEESTPEDQFGGLSRDGEMGTDGDGNYTVNPEEIDSNQWEETNYDDLRSDADCVSIVKVISNYNNRYALNFEQFVKNNREFIDYSGDFKQTSHYNSFVNPAMDLIDKVFQNDPIVKHLQSLIDVMTNKRTVLSVCGKPDNPFIYEGMQIVLVDTLRNVLACIPYSIKNNQSLSEVIESMKLNVVKCLIQMVADLVEVSNLFGTKIYYVEPIISEITGKSEELANTPYTKLDVLQNGNESFTGMRLANESIMNLIEIKNNKALVEYSALTKMMLVITGLTKDVNLAESASNILSEVLRLTTNNGEDIVANIDTTIEVFRNEVFVPEIKAMADLSAEESEQLTKEPETNVNLTQGIEETSGGSTIDIPGQELDDESEERDFDNDLY